MCREGIAIDAMGIYHQQTGLFNKFIVAQIVTSESIIATIRRELRRLFPALKVDVEQISDILTNEVLKREVIEGDKVKEAQQKLKRAAGKLSKQTKGKTTPEAGEPIQTDCQST